MFLLDHPIGQSAIVPLIASLATALLVRLIGGPDRGARLAALAIGVGFLAGYVAILDLPGWPPRGAAQKLAVIAAGAVVLGLAFELARPPRLALGLLLAVGSAGAILWLMAPRLGPDGWAILLWPGAALWLVWLAVLWRLDDLGDRVISPLILVIVAATGLAAFAGLGDTLSGAQLAACLAAATGGFALWNWPKPRSTFGPAGLLGAGAVLLTLASQFMLYSSIQIWALALLLPVFLADKLANRVVSPDGRLGWLAGPAVLAAIALVPVAIAVAIMLFQADGDYPY